jgi:hypothetical protein
MWEAASRPTRECRARQSGRTGARSGRDAYDTLRVGVDARANVGGLIPGFDGGGSVLLATGILGATMMPNVIYLHSALTDGHVPCDDDERPARCSSTGSTCWSRWTSRAWSTC